MFLTCELHVKTGSHRVKSERGSDVETDGNRYFFSSIPEYFTALFTKPLDTFCPRQEQFLREFPIHGVRDFLEWYQAKP